MSTPNNEEPLTSTSRVLLFAALAGLVVSAVGIADYVRYFDQGEATSAAAWAGARSVVMAPSGGDRVEIARRAALQVLGEDSELDPAHVTVSVVEDRERSTLTVQVTIPFEDWVWFFPKPASTTGISAWPMPEVVALR